MCGLTGFWQPRNFSSDTAKATAKGMAARISHRGPDDSGVWVDEVNGMALAHSRLSVLDLSPAGHQPMVSKSGRYVIVFNGEVYNHLELRAKLAASGWCGGSDTETLLQGVEEWGVEETLKRVVGMFAIALWDSKDKVLTLARDRMGEKPLYYGFQHETFLFGSELKAVKYHPDFLNQVDRDVICLYLRHCYIPAPYSIYKGIKKLLPGTFIQLPFLASNDDLRAIEPKPYWSLVEAVMHGQKNLFNGNDSDAIKSLSDVLIKSVGLQMVADVPLGAFLSGGVDSSTVVALMQAQSIRPIKTFSIGFEDAAYNESLFAKSVAQHLGTEHTEFFVTASDSKEVIPLLGTIYDEPFADSSQIPTFLVSKLAKSCVTVALSGDGGDELFGGYNRALMAENWSKIETIPFWCRQITGRVINKFNDKIFCSYIDCSKNSSKNIINISERLGKLGARLTTTDSWADLIYGLSSVIDNPADIVLGAKEPDTWLKTNGVKINSVDQHTQIMLIAAKTYLPDDILVKVDRAAMANSLETRIPLLDHRVVEFSCRLPLKMKIRNGTTKWILRQVLYEYIPKTLIDRPKLGFSIPLGEWLRGPLRGWAEDLLKREDFLRQGFFNYSYVSDKWKMHLDRRQNNEKILWSILMFQSWLEHQ